MKRTTTILITVLLLITGFIASAQQVKVKQPKSGVAGTWRLLGTTQLGLLPTMI